MSLSSSTLAIRKFCGNIAPSLTPLACLKSILSARGVSSVLSAQHGEDHLDSKLSSTATETRNSTGIRRELVQDDLEVEKAIRGDQKTLCQVEQGHDRPISTIHPAQVVQLIQNRSQISREAESEHSNEKYSESGYPEGQQEQNFQP
ncbi:hypothetical protein BDZ89DRAFT_1138893 [Hymenopellis radicata]|nr:hypothetical protein BDZ89DRAFT_1138893 [Hymenopellis radicata]